ncbi:MAG: septum site-determining protein MinC [Firmicutes bacterium]|nr:septum site-determining protein MinC [Bacillota bacterium]
MQGKEAVVFKGYRGGVSVQVDRDAPFGQVVEELRRKLESARNFFHGGIVRIETGTRPPDVVEQRVLKELIRAHGLTIAGDGVDAELANREANGEAKGHGATPSGAPGGQSPPATHGGPGNERGAGEPADEPCLLVRRTLRSGQRLEFDGSVVVLGDVNPGAVIVCSGHAVVMGSLRGVVHAGARGDTRARVIAWRLQPTQLRIAHYISRPPDGEEPSPRGPEMALVHGERIEIEEFVP